jgi:ribosome recycling factor
MSDEYLDAMRDDFENVIASLKRELSTIRTGRATPQLLDTVSVVVQAYGSSMPLNQLATVSAPDARMLLVNPWDKGTLGDIERAIMNSEIDLNPSSDGHVIRVPVPSLTGERRKELVKRVGKMCEDARIRGRGVRKEYNDIFKELESDKEINQDDLKKYQADVQEATNANMQDLSDVAAAKEKEVLDV